MRQGRPSGTVTVLFTDLVGSTELMSRLGEAAFDKIRRAHFAALRQAIVGVGGEEIKNTGDGVMASFGSVVDGVRCGVVMQRATDQQARSELAALAIRVGLSVGEVTFEDGDLFGAPVVEAARLVSLAAPGTILATALVQALARGRIEAEFVEMGMLELKGLPEPLPVCEVLWAPRPAVAAPLPPLLTGVGRVFVGREGELERLAQLWKEAVAGERRVALLAGEPGVGKTRLAAQLAATVHSQGAVVLAGRCDEDLGVPYQPFVEALRHVVDHAPEEDLTGRLGRYGGELVRLVPELADRVPDLSPPLRSDPETERYRLFDAVAAWLAARSDQPVLLVLDDLQWAAKPTLLLLRHVVLSAELKRVLVVGTYRDTDLGQDHPLREVLADLRRQDGVDRISLLGLDPAGVAAFIEQATGHAVGDDDLARAIYEETEGNPFFVREVLRHLTETGALERNEGRWATRRSITELGIPEGVREVVGRRLSRLSEDANRVLRVAAVIGPEFDLSVLRAATENVGEEPFLSALEEAVGARLVLEVPRPVVVYRFAHALVRDTLYRGLSAGRRVTLHRRVGETIERVHAAHLDDYLPALAHHYGRSSAGGAGTSRAVTYATRAGDRALAQLAHDEAVTYYRQALELLAAAGGPLDSGQRLELLISLGEAERRTGEPTHRGTLLEAAHLARERGDASALARAALANSRGFMVSRACDVDNERIGALEAALAAGGDDAVRARLLGLLAMELTFSPDHARRAGVSEEALELARRVGDPTTLAQVVIPVFNAMATPHTLAERLALTAELVELAGRLDDPALISRIWFVRYRASLETGDIEEADRAFEAFTQLAAGLGQPALRWALTWNRAGRLLLAGRIAEADAEVHRALELGEASGQPDARLVFSFQLFPLRLEQGRLGELEEAWLEVGNRSPRLSTFRPALALLYCQLDRDDEARQALAPLAASGFDVPLDLMWGHSVTYCAVVCAHLGDAVGAALLRDRLAPYAGQVVMPAFGVTHGAIAHYVGLLESTLGDHDEAEAHFRMAASIHARIGAPSWLARTRLEWARLLRTRQRTGDAEQARELLGQVLVAARELGLENVERRAVALIR